MHLSLYIQQSHTVGTEKLILCSPIPQGPLFWKNALPSLKPWRCFPCANCGEAQSFCHFKERLPSSSSCGVQAFGGRCGCSLDQSWLVSLMSPFLEVSPLPRLTPQLPLQPPCFYCWGDLDASVGPPRACTCVARIPLCVSLCIFVQGGVCPARQQSEGWKGLPVLQEQGSPLRS